MPDYVSLGGGIPFPAPAGPFFGVAFSLTLDRYGNIYFSAGPGGGFPSAGGGSLTGGWLNQWCKPEEGKLNKFLTGWALSGGAILYGGGGETWSPGNGTATYLGVGSRGVGGSVTGGWRLGNSGLSW
jgi:hypothetical protein